MVIAALTGSPQETAAEAADLIYHLLVLLSASGVPMDEVWDQLLERRGLPAKIEPTPTETCRPPGVEHCHSPMTGLVCQAGSCGRRLDRQFRARIRQTPSAPHQGPGRSSSHLWRLRSCRRPAAWWSSSGAAGLGNSETARPPSPSEYRRI